MTNNQSFDLIVIGAGPGGTSAATLAAMAGLSVALVEEEKVGGTCLNAGCIPTKLFLGATASLPMFATMQKAKCASGEVHFNFDAIQQRKERTLNGFRQGAEKSMVQAGVTIIKGTARFTGTHAIAVENADGIQEYSFKKCIIATGSAPASFPNLVPDGKGVLNSTHLLELENVPESLIIVGGGAIGLEMGDFFSRFGTKITIVEALPQLAPTEDEDIGEVVAKALKREGWTIHTGKRVQSLSSNEDGTATLRFEDGTELHAAKALMAAGRKPASATLACDVVDITTRGAGWIITDDMLLAAPDIYAIGDVNGRTLLAHAASHQARYVVQHITGKTSAPYLSPAMPACIYGHIEVMRAGASVRDMQKQEKTCAVSRAQLIANPIVQSYGTTMGFVKAVWAKDETNVWRLQGLAAVGHGVSHFVGMASIMVEQHWTREDVHSIIYAHPTLDEALEAALSADLEEIPLP